MPWIGLQEDVIRDMAEVAERARDACAHAGRIFEFFDRVISTVLTEEQRQQRRICSRRYERKYRARPAVAKRLRSYNRDRMRRRYATPEGRAAQRAASQRYRASLREKRRQKKAAKE